MQNREDEVEALSEVRMPLPQCITSEEQLEDCLSEPTPAVIDTMRRWSGDLVVLGAAGKMGPSLARMAKRAGDACGLQRRVIAVSRFHSGDESWFHGHGIDTIRGDLLDEAAVARLPDAPNVLYLAGRKFGSTGNESLTWAMNCGNGMRTSDSTSTSTCLFCTHHLHQRFHFGSTADQQRRALVQTGRRNVEDRSAAIASETPGLFRQKCNRVCFVHQPQLALGMSF